MTPFQWLVLPALTGLLALTLGAAATGRLLRREGLVLGTVWALALAAVAQPQWTTALANRLGIGRGADLVLYVSCLATLVGFVALTLRIRRLERQLTLLVRQLALAELERDERTESAR